MSDIKRQIASREILELSRPCLAYLSLPGYLHHSCGACGHRTIIGAGLGMELATRRGRPPEIDRVLIDPECAVTPGHAPTAALKRTPLEVAFVPIVLQKDVEGRRRT